MKRISTATKSVDKFGAGKHGFTNGNAVAGIPATDLEDSWFDSVQEELCAIIEAAGLALDGSNRAQLLAALRAAGVFQTAVLGDRTTKPATCAFVQQEMGGFSNYSSIAASRSLTSADIGQALWFSAAGFTLTLPTPASLGIPLGKAVTVFGNGYTGSIVAGNGAAINFTSVNDGAMSIKPGQSATFVAVSTTTWQVISATAAMSKNADFAASLAVSGYQKLPSGLIIQWGQVTSVANTQVSFNYPIAFPTTAFALTCSVFNSSAGFVGAMGQAVGATSGNVLAQASGVLIQWIALGY
ncbi:gp53-like domain-containing protein [Massilia eburnea]|uniref:gp53-like domain-containing protein n=1 Tax=Massilia eburnea TaxID=1776165 RepID=UPI003D6AC4E9